MRSRSIGLLAAVGLGLACSAPPPPATPARQGIEALPTRLAYLCVTPGCDTSQTIQVSQVGQRRVAIKRVILSEGAEDFTLTASQQAPFILGTGSSFELTVRYLPTRAPTSAKLSVLVTYTDASPTESPDRIPAGELTIPLVRRLVGQPALSARPGSLNLGVVAMGQKKTGAVNLVNAGYGNVAVELESLDAGHADLSAQLPQARVLPPDAGTEVSVTFAPKGLYHLSSPMVVTTANEDVDPAVIMVEATSLPHAAIALEPAGDVNFGEVAKGQPKVKKAFVANHGGQGLTIQSLSVTDASGNVTATFSGGKTTAALGPLDRIELELRLEARTPAELAAQVIINSTDPRTPRLEFQVLGTVTEPKIQLSPATLDFGSVPVGWVLNKPIELRNVGYGPLIVKNISMVSGSSSLFTLQQLPTLPLVLERGQRTAVDVEFKAASAATFNGFVSVESDDPSMKFAEAPLRAVAGSCATGCPIANGTPTCSRGVCEVASCNGGWFDVDKAAANGCECKEIGTDPGSFCADSLDKGTLTDARKTLASHTGIVPTANDIDVIRAFAEDQTQIFSDAFDLQISLQSADPGIKMCIYRYPTGSHQNECYFSNEVCPSDGSYRLKGTLGSDSADILVKVFREANSRPTCTAYTVFMSNGQ